AVSPDGKNVYAVNGAGIVIFTTLFQGLNGLKLSPDVVDLVPGVLKVVLGRGSWSAGANQAIGAGGRGTPGLPAPIAIAPALRRPPSAPCRLRPRRRRRSCPSSPSATPRPRRGTRGRASRSSRSHSRPPRRRRSRSPTRPRTGAPRRVATTSQRAGRSASTPV